MAGKNWMFGNKHRVPAFTNTRQSLEFVSDDCYTLFIRISMLALKLEILCNFPICSFSSKR